MALPYVPARIGRWPWMMQRVSAVLLLFLAFSHFAIQHFTADAVSTGLTVTQRMNDPWWQSYYAVFVILVMYHGINGMIGICYDYMPKPLTRNIIALILWTAGGFFGVLGLINIVDTKSVEEVKAFYARHGFGKGTSNGHTSFTVEYDLQQPKSELGMLKFYLTHHTDRTDEATVEAVFAAEDGTSLDQWARKQLLQGPPRRPPHDDEIFHSSYEFALWALNVRKQNAISRGDTELADRLADVPAYTPYSY